MDKIHSGQVLHESKRHRVYSQHLADRSGWRNQRECYWKHTPPNRNYFVVADFQPRLSNLDHRYGALEPMEGLHGPLWRLPRNDEFCIEAKRLQAAIHQGIPAWLAHHGQACLMAETCTPQLPQASTQPTSKKRHDGRKKDQKVEQLLLYFAD